MLQIMMIIIALAKMVLVMQNLWETMEEWVLLLKVDLLIKENLNPKRR